MNDEVEITHSLAEHRKVLRRIIESQYNDSDSMRLIEVLFMNVQTQDDEFIENIKTKIKKVCIEGFELGSKVPFEINKEIDVSTGFALHEKAEVPNE